MSAGDVVMMKAKSYDHLIRTRDRALRRAEFEQESAEHARAWAGQAFDEQRRLADRLNAVVAAAASLGVSIHAINEALDICRCGCPSSAHVGEVGCPCGLPDEPPCNPRTPPASTPEEGQS